MMHFSLSLSTTPARSGPKLPRRAIRSLACVVLTFLTLSCADPAPSAAPLAPDAVILAFGDSLTYGSGADQQESYPAVLEKLIQRRVVNAGVPGEITAEGADRLPELLDRHAPALVILCHGGNDLLRRIPESSIEAHLRQMIQAIRSRGAGVLLIAVPRPTLLRLQAAPLYARLAEELRVAIESETLPELESNPGYKSDQIHLNAEGYRLLAEGIARLLRESGALPQVR
jgi:acyl-CoA thioesterase I